MLVTLAADAAVIAPDASGDLGILLIQRADDSDAFPGCWALPGGLVNVEEDETSRSAAARELREETGLDISIIQFERVDVYDTPLRDPRGRVVSVAYIAYQGSQVAPVAADDAKFAAWVPVSQVFDLALAFDHRQIIADALARIGFGHFVP